MNGHGLRKPDDWFEAIRMQVLLASQRSHDLREGLEVVILHEQSVLFQERDDPLSPVFELRDRVGHDRALRTTVIEVAASEVDTGTLQQSVLGLVLEHVEGGSELPSPHVSGMVWFGGHGYRRQPSPSTNPTIQLESSHCVVTLVSC